MRQPPITTERLLLRAFSDDDAGRLAALGGARRIADTTISVPHPYSIEQAAADIGRFNDDWDVGRAIHFAIAPAGEPDAFVGYIAVKDISEEHAIGELSFWIDESAAGRGFVTEAGSAVIRFAFDRLSLNRVYAHHMVRNAASAGVLARLGMRPEGRLRQRVRKWGVFEDVSVAAILKSDV